MSAFSTSYSSALGSNFYNYGGPASIAIGTPGSYTTSYSNSLGTFVPDITNTGVASMAVYTQLPADWAVVTGVAQTLNKPTLSVANATGSYADLLNTPVISTVGHSGLYSHLIGQPVISTIGHTGNYTDLIGTPAISVVAHSGNYTDIIGIPQISNVGPDRSTSACASGYSRHLCFSLWLAGDQHSGTQRQV